MIKWKTDISKEHPGALVSYAHKNGMGFEIHRDDGFDVVVNGNKTIVEIVETFTTIEEAQKAAEKVYEAVKDIEL